MEEIDDIDVEAKLEVEERVDVDAIVVATGDPPNRN